MKTWKKVLSLTLALVMALALTVPAALAEEGRSGLYVNTANGVFTNLEGTIFYQRGTTYEEVGEGDVTGIVRLEAEPTPLDGSIVYAVHLGMNLEVYFPSVSIHAWTDPDGDGVYTPVLAQITRTVGGSATDQGYATQTYSSEFVHMSGQEYLEDIRIDEGNQVFHSGSFILRGVNELVTYTETGVDSYGAKLSAGWLTEQFGPNAMITMRVWVEEWGDYGYYYLLLTGEKADPATLDGENVAVTNGGAVVSSWAQGLITSAEESGLVPAIMQGLDLTPEITRAQFAAVTVRLYEAMSGQAAPAADWDACPFADLYTDEGTGARIAGADDIIKAYQLGITSGTSATAFSPDALLTREQASVMLSAVYRQLGGVVAAVNPGVFADDASISEWAKASVYFMAENGIVAGVGDNRFDARSNAQCQAALIMALRMLQNL